jgi:hypothetical protein
MTPFSCGIVLNSGSSFTCRDACAVMRVQSCVCREPRTYGKHLPTTRDVKKVPPDPRKLPVPPGTSGGTSSTPRHPRTNGKYLLTPQEVRQVPPDTPGGTSSTSRHPKTYIKYIQTPHDERQVPPDTPGSTAGTF